MMFEMGGCHNDFFLWLGRSVPKAGTSRSSSSLAMRVLNFEAGWRVSRSSIASFFLF